MKCGRVHVHGSHMFDEIYKTLIKYNYDRYKRLIKALELRYEGVDDETGTVKLQIHVIRSILVLD